MEESSLIVFLLTAVSATSIAAIAQFLVNRVFKKADADLKGWKAKLDELQAENDAIAKDIEGFRANLTEINYGAVKIEVNGPELPEEQTRQLIEDVIRAVKRHIPEAHAEGDVR